MKNLAHKSANHQDGVDGKVIKFPVTPKAVDGSISQVNGQNGLENPKQSNQLQPIKPQSLMDDIDYLTATKLSQKYYREYSSWKNMKCRCKKLSKNYAPEFETFKSFLLHVGQMPTGEKTTLDRINTFDPNYNLNGVRWATAEVQNNNKTTSKTLKPHPDQPENTYKYWAEKAGKSVKTLYDRRKKGWSDYEIVYGRSEGSPYFSELSWSSIAHPALIKAFDLEQSFRRRGCMRRDPNHRAFWLLCASSHELQRVAEPYIDLQVDRENCELYGHPIPPQDIQLERLFNIWGDTVEMCFRSLKAEYPKFDISSAHPTPQCFCKREP